MGLMGIQLMDPPLLQHRNQPLIQHFRISSISGLAGREGFPAHDIAHKQRIALELLGQLINVQGLRPPFGKYGSGRRALLTLRMANFYYTVFLFPCKGEQGDFVPIFSRS